MNSKAIGEVAEAKALSRLVEAGFSVSIPFGNNQRYDLIIDIAGKLLRAQCKSGKLSQDGSVIRYNCCSTNGFTGESMSYRGQVEVFIVYCPDTGLVYMIPVEDAPQKIGHLRVKSPKKSHSGVKMAARYVI